jgi:hypothetical protein
MNGADDALHHSYIICHVVPWLVRCVSPCALHVYIFRQLQRHVRALAGGCARRMPPGWS